MPTKRVNYSKIRDQKRKEAESVLEKTATEEPQKIYLYAKKNPSRIRIRKGPGTNFEHNGRYLDEVTRVELIEIQGDWGLLKSYKATRDGWVCLTYLEPIAGKK